MEEIMKMTDGFTNGLICGMLATFVIMLGVSLATVCYCHSQSTILKN